MERLRRLSRSCGSCGMLCVLGHTQSLRQSRAMITCAFGPRPLAGSTAHTTCVSPALAAMAATSPDWFNIMFVPGKWSLCVCAMISSGKKRPCVAVVACSFERHLVWHWCLAKQFSGAASRCLQHMQPYYDIMLCLTLAPV